jgi:hypothetical protein
MPAFRHTTDLEQLNADIAVAADLAGAPYDDAKTWKILSTFRQFFSGSPVSFRTSTKPERDINVRYVELSVPHDPYRIAVTEGLIQPSGHPIDDVMADIQASYPILGYGLDFGAACGVEKIWPFFPHRPQPVEAVYAMPRFPASIRNHADFLARYDLSAVSILGIDYRHRTVNLYFLKPPGFFESGRLKRMITELGFDVPSDELLRHCSMAVPIYLTFSWTSPVVERLCFAAVAPTPGDVPAHVHPVIDRYVDAAPFATDRRLFIYNVTMARGGNFIKIENDYTGSMADLMRVFPPEPGAHEPVTA